MWDTSLSHQGILDRQKAGAAVKLMHLSVWRSTRMQMCDGQVCLPA